MYQSPGLGSCSGLRRFSLHPNELPDFVCLDITGWYIDKEFCEQILTLGACDYRQPEHSCVVDFGKALNARYTAALKQPGEPALRPREHSRKPGKPETPAALHRIRVHGTFQ